MYTSHSEYVSQKKLHEMDGKEEAEPISPLTESELTYNTDRSNTAGGA